MILVNNPVPGGLYARCNRRIGMDNPHRLGLSLFIFIMGVAIHFFIASSMTQYHRLKINRTVASLAVGIALDCFLQTLLRHFLLGIYLRILSVCNGWH